MKKSTYEFKWNSYTWIYFELVFTIDILKLVYIKIFKTYLLYNLYIIMYFKFLTESYFTYDLFLFLFFFLNLIC